MATKKWYAFNNRLRKNVIESTFNDFSDFNGRGGYIKSDCDEIVSCTDPANPSVIPQNCSEQKTLYVVKTFALAGFTPENQAAGASVCGNVANEQGALDWGVKPYKGKNQPVQFSRIKDAAQNQPICEADANNAADPAPPGIRGGCVGAECTGSLK